MVLLKLGLNHFVDSVYVGGTEKFPDCRSWD